MKKCIWCNKEYPRVKFEKNAHTIPQSLGGTNICEHVCDDCNHFFGSPSNNNVAIEVALKEVLNISRFFLLSKDKKYSQKLGRFKSQFFDVDWSKYSMKAKIQYKLQQGFQARFGRQFRKGIFKIFLEERHRFYKDAFDSRYDFIREFSRYDIGNFPVYYRIPSFPACLVSTSEVFNPKLRFNSDTEKLDEEFRMYEFGLIGHNFTIPTSKAFELRSKEYFERIYKSRHPLGHKFEYVDIVEKVDFTFRYFDNLKIS